MIDFPSSPTTGQICNSGTGPIYIWDGVAWSLVTQATRTARQNNLIVNPAMAVSQENGATAGSAPGYYPVDQWLLQVTPAIVTSVQQVSSLTPDLSLSRIRKTVTTRKQTLVAGDLVGVYQPIEGNRMACLGYGTANAIQSVARVGVKAPAGTYSFSIGNDVGNRSYVKNFTIAAGQANTDTIQTFVIPGDTAGTWKTDNTASAFVGVYDAIGTTYQGVEGWQAGNIAGTAANTNMVATNGNVVELFDVGLYPDPERTGLPPPFIAPIYAQAQIDCMRYWEQVGTTSVNNYLYLRGDFKVQKRIPPTITVAPGSSASGATFRTMPAAATSAWRQDTVSSTAVDTVLNCSARM